MSRLLSLSSRMYERLLLFYPGDLRREFGAEMALAFSDDLESAWGAARLAGVAQIWWYALRELLTVALPGQTSNPSVLVPALSFAVVVSVQCAELCLALHQATRVDLGMLADGIRFVVLLPAVLSATVALIVTRVYAHCPIATLQLD
jgi:hypothetical protein